MKKTQHSKLKLGVAPLVMSVALVSAPAFAQDAPAAEEGDAPIVVTGTRIPQPNLESVSPVTVVSGEDIKLQGTTKIEDMLNSLPSVFASQASTLSNGADGTASVDLRGLGTARTLSLVNGRRLIPGDPGPSSGSAADINIIPSAILKRVDVLTGGASSTYGADAVAGVVNFIVDTEFTGIRVDGQYSFFQHNNNNKLMPPLLDARAATSAGYGYPRGSVADGGTVDATVMMGSGFDDGRGHAMVYFGYRKANPIVQSNRDYSACTLQNTRAGANQCGGSATSPEGNVLVFENGTSTFYTFEPNGGFRNGNTLFNFAPTNYFQRSDERYTAGLFANYEINDSIKPYMEFMFMDDRTVAQIAPSGNFGNTLTINSDNPLISDAQRDIIFAQENLINGFLGTFPLAGGAPYNPNPGAAPIDFVDPTTGNTYNKAYFQLLRRNTEGGSRRSDLQHTSFRGVLGVKGDLSPVWSYDAYYQYGRVNYSQVYSNEFSAARLTRALDVVADPNGGAPVCRSVLDGSDPTCVPYNVFAGLGGASPEAVAYLSATGFQKGQTSEQVASASLTGQLGEYGFKSPWAEDGIAINVGVEWRRESLELLTDNAFQTGDLTGQGGATLPLSGNFRVYDFFAEASVPIVQNSFIDDLSFSGGYRHSSYKTSSGNSYKTDTYKLALEFAPVSDIRFRGAYNRAVRAPNIQELFATPTVALNGSGDPCAGITITATDYGCLAQGLVVGQRTAANPAGQYNGFIGGNQDLQPETATTKTLGVVLRPSFLPRFNLTVDYFDIKVADAIRAFGQDSTLADCVANATATFTPDSCDLVNRDAAGSLWLTPGGYVVDLPNNVGSLRTKGIEINSAYSHELGDFGTLSLSFIGTYLDKYLVNNGLTEPYDCAGLYGPTCSAGGTTQSGAPLPKWRHKLRTTLKTNSGIGLSVQWRQVGKVKAETLSDNPSLAGDFNFEPGLRVKAQNYFDLAATFDVGDSFIFRLGANNIFDKEPPLITSGSGSRPGSNLCPTGPCNGNTYPATWDSLGRYFYAGATLEF
ncbi:TonB-dependent receptor domain-containing protein [Sphingopyxis sp. JAI128]|uniref:TonB-dependent receptor domain-containing protein n=1 Tax=Sphingopyxis sp. JAI128 TaxID=2723066 RepID=UPI0018038636|nr:TonB-dependent receptor [Sphingopyxis sp. JAI128]MBB6426554.1 outer membrane receptor protein involved in Fe transport [Sphingopyxis sp. JAI128]